MLAVGCQDFMELELENGENITDSSIVEVLENGQIRVTATLESMNMADISVSSRAGDYENDIVDGWCLIFGEAVSEQGNGMYSDNSPLLQKVPITVNANGTFFMTFTPYAGTAFLRIVANLTNREDTNLTEKAVAWADAENDYETDENGVTWLRVPNASDDLTGVSTFGDYRLQSVGIDGIYDMGGNYKAELNLAGVNEAKGDFPYTNVNTTIQPDPKSRSNAIPMSSIGFVLNGITEESLEDVFGTKIYMVRVCSKVEITVTDNNFIIYEVYMIECAQESRVRSTVLSSTSTDLGVPVNLGGTIDYLPLEETVITGKTTSPIYIYPNSGGDYDSNDGAVDRDVNPQYVIIKGRADGYDTDGYYKIALKGRYPKSYVYDTDGNIATDGEGNYIVEEYYDLTYDILRNTNFKIDLISVDKPGYKTLEDAKDDNNPANNISYNIIITSGDGRNEILISNGTYYVELNTTRVYMSGYGNRTDDDSGTVGSINFTLHPNSDDENYQHPAVYVMADYGVTIESCYADGVSISKTDLTGTDYADAADSNVNDYWFMVPESVNDMQVTVNFSANYSGRIRLRIGDMLKFVPVRYVDDMITYNGEEKLQIGTETDFSYDDIVYLTTTNNVESVASDQSGTNYMWFTSGGEVVKNSESAERELRAMIYPKDADGITKLYFWQTSNVDTGARDDDTTDGMSNVIYMDDSSKKYDTAKEIAERAVEILEAGYTTIYINGTYTDAKFFSGNTSVFDLINTYLKDSTVLYSIVLEEVDSDDQSIMDDFKSDFFKNNKQIVSVVLPGSENCAKIDEEAFYGCTNLQYVIIGDENNLTKLDSIETKAFYGCTSLQYVTVYTNMTEVNYKSTSFSNSGLSSTYKSTSKVSVSNNVAHFSN